MVFGTVFADAMQVRLARLFQDYSLFLSDAGHAIIQAVFLLPFSVMVWRLRQAPKPLRWFVVALWVRVLVFGILQGALAPELDVQLYAALWLFATLLIDVLFVVGWVRYFNHTEVPFGTRAVLLLWAFLRIEFLTASGSLAMMLDLVVPTLLLVGLVLITNALLLQPSAPPSK
jgi:hypothetical protein